MMKRQEIKSFVRKHEQVEVTFTKVDGSKRVLAGTVKDYLIPKEDMPAGESKAPAAPDHLVRIYDLENNGWRAFKIETVHSIVGMTAQGEVKKVIDVFED